MKKFLRAKSLPIIVPVAGLLGLLLRVWTIGTGADKEGLYEPHPAAWALLWIVTGLTLLSVLWLTAKLKNPGRYFDNFPASLPGAIGSAAAAVVILIGSIGTLTGGTGLLTTVTGIVGILSGVCLLLTAYARFTGQKPSFFLHAIPCLYFALRIFNCCKGWSNEPQISVFLFPFLASICVMLASYQLASYDVNLGKRRSCLFWSFASVYFCMLAIPGGEDPLFYGAMAIWLITNLCSLRPLGKRKPQPPVDAAPVPAEEKPAEDMSLDELKQWLDQQ